MQILVNINDDGSVTACQVQGQMTSEAATITTPVTTADASGSMNAGASPFAPQQNQDTMAVKQSMNIEVTPGFNGGARLQTIN